MPSWIFEQLGGQRKTIVLTGSAAPHGRPRQKPVVKDGLKLRAQVTRYPGYSGDPTRHLFGTERDDIVLIGRWMDHQLFGDPAGTGARRNTARILVDTWEAFISDQQQVRVSWGDTVAYIGVIDKLVTGWESETQVAWELHILVDRKISEKQAPAAATPTQPPHQFAKEFAKFFAKRRKSLEQTVPDWDPTVLDLVNGLFQTVAVATSQLVKISNAYDDFEKQTFSQLQRLRLAVHEVKTAYLNFRDTTDSFQLDGVLFARSAKADVNWMQFRSQEAAESSVFLDLLNELARHAELAQRGKNNTSTTAVMGDTWESISTRLLNNPFGANDIRKANNITFGAQPVVGKVYRIPKK